MEYLKAAVGVLFDGTAVWALVCAVYTLAEFVASFGKG